MLNRRLLRIKAMQALYAYQKSLEANYELAKEYVRDCFKPDLNSMEVQDKELLKQQAQEAMKMLAATFDEQASPNSEAELNKEIRDAVTGAYALYQKKKKEDYEQVRKTMLQEAEQVAFLYMKLLQLFPVLADEVEKEVDRKRNNDVQPTAVFESDLNFARNQVVQIIKADTEFQADCIKQGALWEDEEIDIQQWYKEGLKKDEEYKAYLKIQNPTFEQDKEFVRYLIGNFIFKNPLIVQYMEEADLYWTENKSVLKSMVKKSVKSMEEGDSSFERTYLSLNWEDDKEFFRIIFEKTIAQEEETEEMIAAMVKNWDMERIADLDKIVLQMALTEMLNFPSIPVKVTINEYIDISKNYSTLKSKQFINGVLDKASERLTAEGKIRKSGRGLIDNK